MLNLLCLLSVIYGWGKFVKSTKWKAFGDWPWGVISLQGSGSRWQSAVISIDTTWHLFNLFSKETVYLQGQELISDSGSLWAVHEAAFPRGLVVCSGEGECAMCHCALPVSWFQPRQCRLDIAASLSGGWGGWERQSCYCGGAGQGAATGWAVLCHMWPAGHGLCVAVVV